MSTPPPINIRDVGREAERMAKDCKNERLVMTMKYVALCSMIVMAGAAGVHLMKEMFGHTEHHGRSR
jgi:hypothetical protein